MKRIFSILLIGLLFTACEESLEFDLEGDQIDIDEALSSPENMKGLLNSCYDVFANVMDGDVQNMHSLLGEELSSPQNAAGSLYFTVYNRGTFSFRTADGILLDLYRTIYRCNVFLENSDLFAEQLNITQLNAEATVLRAWAHWELVKLWAQPYGYTENNTHPGVAIRLKSAYEVQLRSTVQQVYDQVIGDVKAAAAALPETNGGYISKDAAHALLAKIYFLMNDFTNAEQYAAMVIESGRYSLSADTERFIGDQASDRIFGTISTGPNDNRGDAFGAYRSDNNDNPGLRPSKAMTLMYDTADERGAWVELIDVDQPSENYKCHKFDKDFFDVPLLHLADLMLIRAESLLELGNNKQTALDHVNAIINRAYGDTNHEILIDDFGKDDVRAERRKEMAFEGDDCLQLRRRGAKGEAVTIRGTAWDCPGMVLQFPASEKTEGFVFNEEGSCN